MLKKDIAYIDYDGNSRTETFYFNINKAEITEMELSETGGLSTLLKKIIAEQDAKKMIAMFKDLVLKSYGIKSPDGKRFIKNEEVRNEFVQTEAYSVLFMELAMNADAAVHFVENIMPPDMKKKE